MPSNFQLSGLSVLALALLVSPPTGGKEPREPYQVPMLSPEDALESFRLPDGYRLELVAHEPMIEEPVTCAWDANGRMYVAEMRTYMQDIDGRDQFRPISRVVRLEDTDGDGVMDRHSVFVDKLVLPRMILPLDDRVVIRETNTLDLWVYRDTTGDGVADEKKLWHQGGRRGGNLEHQPSGLVWNIDNWIYTTYSAHRYRFSHGKVVREGLPSGSGQWGLAKDDVGKLYYSTAGGEQPAMDFQQPIVYGRIRMSDELAHGFKEVFPLDDIPDTQGGRGRLRPDNTLNHFTGCGGQGVFRGDRLPEDLRGDLIIPEAVGRLIRRAKIENHAGKTVLKNAYQRKEFIATPDPNFRPLCAATGPDGCLYIVDMYRGIIQEGSWVRPGSYLRGVVEAYGLDRNIGKGRIYRLVHEDFERGPRPRMLEESSTRLVAHLSHPNGWWRDTAQKLLVVRGDRTVAPLLRATAREAVEPLARLHALWTLEGLDAVEWSLLKRAMRDDDPRVRAAAVRISERFLPEDGEEILPHFRRLGSDPDPNVVIQVLLSVQITEAPGGEELSSEIAARYPDNDAIRSILRSQVERRERIRAEAEKAAELRRQNLRFARAYEKGQVTYKTLCVTCHGDDGEGAPSPDKAGETLAPPLAGSPRVLGDEARLIRILLHGLTGPVDEKNYTELMVPMGSNDNEWVSSVATYVRNTWKNRAGYVSPGAVAAIREVESARRAPWTLAELHRFDPKLSNRKQWRLAASHGAGEVRRAIDGNRGSRWATGKPMHPGMWFEIELPAPARIYSVILDAASSGLDYPVSYELRLSDDGKTWGDPVTTGKGDGVLTRILFEPTTTRHLRITQTGHRPGKFWSIHDLQILEAPEPVDTPRAAAVNQHPPLDELLERRGDAEKGRSVFEKRCTTCHQIGGAGTSFGPDLSEVGSRLDRNKIYEAIFEPNATVEPPFRGVVVQTKTGSFLSGLVVRESKEKLTLRQPGGKDTEVPVETILFKQEQESSFMPEDLEKGLATQELIDLVEFLAGRKQAASP